MSLATTCTACATVFRVAQGDLDRTGGKVRCGACGEVFNAMEGLFDLDGKPVPKGLKLPIADSLMRSSDLARKFELAQEFQQIGDLEGALKLLREILAQSDGPLWERARHLLKQLSPSPASARTVARFAAELGRPVGVLLGQLEAAGVVNKTGDDALTDGEVKRLLDHIRVRIEAAPGEVRRPIVIKRKSAAESGQGTSPHKDATIQVEVRKKRDFVRRSDSAPAPAAEEAELARRSEAARLQAEHLRREEERMAEARRQREERERRESEAAKLADGSTIDGFRRSPIRLVKLSDTERSSPQRLAELERRRKAAEEEAAAIRVMMNQPKRVLVAKPSAHPSAPAPLGLELDKLRSEMPTSPPIDVMPARVESPLSSTKIASPVEDAAPAIFMSYRRDDSTSVSGRIHDRLVDRFSSVTIFKDVDSIPLGADFREHLAEAVDKCSIMLAIIGRHWLTIKDPDGKRRIDASNDFVRIEIAAALRRGIPVVPVLVEGAALPAEQDLPAELQALSYKQATHVRPDPDFRSDMERLMRWLESQVGATGRRSPQ